MDRRNWELLCSFVANNTFIQDLRMYEQESDDEAMDVIILQSFARTSLLLQAMRKNASLVFVIFVGYCNELRWADEAPPLIERNRIRAIATAPECIRRQLATHCLDNEQFPNSRASLLYFALRSSKWNDDLVTRLNALIISAKKRPKLTR
jgi:hypothetical protein